MPEALAVRAPVDPGSRPDDGSEPASALERRGSWLQTARAVAWSFLGIRRASGLAEDVQKLNPLHVVLVGLAGAALFVVLLVLLVRWVVASGVAGV